MAEEKKNHWSFLTNLLGVPSSAAEDESDAESAPAEAAAEKPNPAPPMKEKKERKPPATKSPGWGQLANEFGLAADEPEPTVADEPEHVSSASSVSATATAFVPAEQEVAAAPKAPKRQEMFTSELPPQLPGFGVTARAVEKKTSTWEPDAEAESPERDDEPRRAIAESEPAWRDEETSQDMLVEDFEVDDDDEQDTEKKPRRRRRRRKRRSESEEDRGGSAVRKTDVAADDRADLDEVVFDEVLETADEVLETADDNDDAEAEPEPERRPRRRRRRRSARDERPATVSDDSVSTVKESDVDDEIEEEPRRRRGRGRRERVAEHETAPDVEPVGDIDNREDEEVDRARPRLFASWSDTIGHVIEANLAKRNRTNGRGGGRGRGGRGRPREQSNKGERGRRGGGEER